MASGNIFGKRMTSDISRFEMNRRIYRLKQYSRPLGTALFLGSLLVLYAFWPRTEIDAPDNLVTACMRYLQSEGRAEHTYMPTASVLHRDTGLLTIRFIDTIYSTANFRKRSLRGDKCVANDRGIDLDRSRIAFEENVRPFVEQCVANYRIELPGQVGFHFTSKKYRAPTEDERDEQRVGFCRRWGTEEMQRFLAKPTGAHGE